MAHDSGKFGAGLGAQSVTADERKSATGPQKEESATTAEVEATGMTGGVTDLLIEKRKSLEQIRQRRVRWTWMILAVPVALFFTLLWLMLFSTVDWRVVAIFAVGTFSCIVAVCGLLINGLYRVTKEDDSLHPVMDALKDWWKSRGGPGDS